MKLSTKNLAIAAFMPLLVLSGCNDSDSSNSKQNPGVPDIPVPSNYSFEVVVTNLTYAQPMSPVAVILHDEGSFWALGETSSVGLEKLAESGDSSDLLNESFVLSSQTGAGMLMPGMSETINVSFADNHPELLSIATMLVNTNDAFTGVNAMPLTNLRAGESISFTTRSYDAGTERNTELMATIPGPASGGTGEGYNELRDDIDKVGMHAGVVSVDDGLTSSVLTQAHKFDNPTLKITVSRIE